MDERDGQDGLQSRRDDNRQQANLLEDEVLLRPHPHRAASRRTYSPNYADVLLAPRRQVAEFSDLEPVEVFDLTLTLKLLTRAMETFYSCNASTIHIQNSGSNGALKHLIVHIIPRKAGDLKSNDMIYEMLRTYPDDLLKHYASKKREIKDKIYT